MENALSLSTAPIQELHNAHVRFTLHDRPASIVEFSVEVLAPLAQKARASAVRALSKEITQPGFRKGKATEAFNEKSYPTDLDKEWQQQLARMALNECLSLAKIVPLHKDPQWHFQMKSHGKQGALLQIFVEVEPKIPHVDPTLFCVKAVARPEVGEKQIEETLRQVQCFFGNWSPVTDRPVQQGDFVLLDVDGVEPAESIFKEIRFEVTPRRMAQWMLDLVVGRQVGDEIEGISTPDADAPAQDQALEPKKVRLTIRALETMDAPPLDDALATRVGVSSLDELRTQVTALLNKQADAHVQEKQREQVVDFLLNDCPFELPRSLVNKEVEFRFRQLWQDPSFQQYWNGLPPEEQKELIQTVRTQSDKAVRLFYLCRRVLSDAQVTVGPADVAEPATDLLTLLVAPSAPQERKSPELEHAEAYSRLILEKAQDFIIRGGRSTC